MKSLLQVAKADLFRAEDIPVGPALLKPVFCQGPRGRGNDRAVSARIIFTAAGRCLRTRSTQAGYMTATALCLSPRQESLACGRGPYMTEMGRDVKSTDIMPVPSNGTYG